MLNKCYNRKRKRHKHGHPVKHKEISRHTKVTGTSEMYPSMVHGINSKYSIRILFGWISQAKEA
jgi:hypothetical protein